MCTLALIAGLSAGCGSSLPRPIPVEAAPPPSSVEAIPPGSVVAIKRPTPGVALLSLWLDAGARDGTPAQVAAAAAFWAAQQASASPRVLAEGTELQTRCVIAQEPLAQCAKRLLKALAPPAPSPADALKLRERVGSARIATTHDDARAAERLALSGLLGAEPARGLFPLGDERQDEAVNAPAVKAFLDRFYGRAHALLIGLGDVEKRELERALSWPQSRTGQGGYTRSPLTLQSAVRVEVADSNVIALALPMRGVEEAARLCQRFRDVYEEASAHISTVDGVTLAHLTLPAPADPFARLQSAVFDVHRLLREPSAAQLLPPPDGLEDLARKVGERWVARHAGTRPEQSALAVALLVRREQRAPSDEAETLAKLSERAQRAVEAGAHNSLGTVKGELTDAGARVQTQNGATIRVEKRAGEAWFAGLVRIGGGSELDAPTGHGRAALLATLMADGCGVANGRALDHRLADIGARLTPLVDAEGLGVMVSAPRDGAHAALDLLLRCALRPLFQARALEDARARLLKSLWSDEALLLQATLAQLLSPAAPGLVAPWGTPAGVGKVELTELSRFHAQRMQAANLSVFVNGDVEPAEIAAFVARRLAYLPDAEVAAPSVQPSAAPEVMAALVSDTRLRVVVGVRTTSARHERLGEQVFARAFQQALLQRVGGDSVAMATGARDHFFAGVALTVRDDQIEATRAHAQAALAELHTRDDAHFRGALSAALAAQNATLSSARGSALFAFEGREAGPLDLAAELALIRKLAREQPSFFVLRPRP